MVSASLAVMRTLALANRHVDGQPLMQTYGAFAFK